MKRPSDHLKHKKSMNVTFKLGCLHGVGITCYLAPIFWLKGRVSSGNGMGRTTEYMLPVKWGFWLAWQDVTVEMLFCDIIEKTLAVTSREKRRNRLWIFISIKTSSLCFNSDLHVQDLRCRLIPGFVLISCIQSLFSCYIKGKKTKADYLFF